MATGTRWRENELKIVLNIYHKLPFGQLHARNPVVCDIASKLGRSANSVAMKLVNFASLDPVLKLRGVRGLAGASQLDRDVWDTFHASPNEQIPSSESALRELFGADDMTTLEVLPKEGIHLNKISAIEATDVTREVKVRRGQEFFRNTVLNNFGGKCGISQINLRDLLVASHILPWSKYPTERITLKNGLCLSRLHDAAFDRGYIAFDDNLGLLLSPQLKAVLPNPSIELNFAMYDGYPLRHPEDSVPPDLGFLKIHRETIFLHMKT